jgi:hypothetical protein
MTKSSSCSIGLKNCAREFHGNGDWYVHVAMWRCGCGDVDVAMFDVAMSCESDLSGEMLSGNAGESAGLSC